MSNADFDTLHMTPRPGPAAHPSPAEPLKTPARGHPYASNPGRIATSRRSPTRQPPGPTSPKPQYLQAIHRQLSPPRGSLQKSHTPTADDRSAQVRRSRPACASPRLRQSCRPRGRDRLRSPSCALATAGATDRQPPARDTRLPTYDLDESPRPWNWLCQDSRLCWWLSDKSRQPPFRCEMGPIARSRAGTNQSGSVARGSERAPCQAAQRVGP